ncbi:MAG: DUF4914 family protein [Planctomycetota bacterium]
MLTALPEKVTLSTSAMTVLKEAKSVTFAGSVEELVALAVPEDSVGPDGYHTVAYEVNGEMVPELKVCRVKNGIAANYLEPYMRRRDPNCMCIADSNATDKPTFKARFGYEFDDLRTETLEWLKTQDLAAFFFHAGMQGDNDVSGGLPGLAICPANAGFFALGLALLQGIVPLDKIDESYHHAAIVYIAPPFRHTHFDGKQVVVHNRRKDVGLHELFSYNLYPGPSAKKGVYGMLLTKGESGSVSKGGTKWTTAHCATVQVVTPYDNTVTIMHEGASGGGKSEMLEHIHREADGRLRLGTNTVTDETRHLAIPRGCQLNPVTDDMALCYPGLESKNSRGAEKKVTLTDAEQAWFLRVNHITHYGKDPHLERLTAEPKGPLLFLNIDAKPGATALIWQPTMDDPETPCPNPRVVVPRSEFEGIVNEPVTIDIRSFGVRCPPCTKDLPTYGIMGLFHLLPPSLAWLWRLVAPRGHGNPSIVDQGGMQSEGVGSYWPFATGRRVDQANILLEQVMSTTDTMFILCPNQHVGCWEVGFAPQWITREYLARRGSTPFNPDHLLEARCPLLGRTRQTIHVEGQTIGHWFLQVETQPEVGEEAYDKGAAILKKFFDEQLANFNHDELDPLGKQIIQACLDNADLATYDAFKL